MPELLPESFHDIVRRRFPSVMRAAHLFAEALPAVRIPIQLAEWALDDPQRPPHLEKVHHAAATEVLEDLASRVMPELARKHGRKMAASMLIHEADRDRSVQSQVFAHAILVDNMIRTEANFIAFGRRTYHIAPQLAARLARTEINLPGDLVRLPFPSCMLVFDDPDARKAAVTFSNRPDMAPATPVTVFLSEQKPPEGIERIRAIDIDVAFLTKNGSKVFLQRSLAVPPEARLEDVIKTDWGKVTSLGPEVPSFSLASFDASDFAVHCLACA